MLNRSGIFFLTFPQTTYHSEDINKLDRWSVILPSYFEILNLRGLDIKLLNPCRFTDLRFDCEMSLKAEIYQNANIWVSRYSLLDLSF